MRTQLDLQILESRCRLQNPYAHLDGEGGYSAKTSATKHQVIESRTLLEDPYAYLDGEGGYSVASPSISGSMPQIDIDDIRNPRVVGKRLSLHQIETITRSLQTRLWANRKELLGNKYSDDPVSILNPETAFRAIGYNFELSSTLGQFTTNQGLVDCAGFIDKSKMYAGISCQNTFPIRNFTGAHELGHALLHDAAGMHRDRALDGGSLLGPRDRTEIEADKFATFFLMPEKLVRAEFKKRFLTECFVVTDDSAFALISAPQDKIWAECNNLRSLSRKLSDASHFRGKFFKSMTERFGVSSTAMAIRLEELKLLQF